MNSKTLGPPSTFHNSAESMQQDRRPHGVGRASAAAGEVAREEGQEERRFAAAADPATGPIEDHLNYDPIN